jgi:MFS family permease
VKKQAIENDINWRAAGAAIGAISVIGIAIGLGVPLLSIVLEKQGFSASVIGANTAIAGVAALFAAPLGPRIAHLLGLAPAMALMIVLSAGSFVAFYFFQSLALWFVLRFVLHFALTVLFILSEFWISSAAPPSRRGFILGIYATVLSVGFAAGPLIFAATGSDGPLPFYCGAIIASLALIPLVLAWNDAITIESSDVHGFLPYIWLVPTATAAVLVFGAVETGGFSLFPVFGSRLGMPETDVALLLTAIGLGNVLLQIPLGLLSDRVSDRRYVLMGCAAIGLVGSLLLPVVITNWWLTAVIMFFWGGVVAGLYTVGLAHLTTKTPHAALAQANAAFVFCYAFGMLVGPQSMGALMDVVGDNGYAWTLAAFFIAYLALAGSRLAVGR